MITLNALDILNPVCGNVISKEFIVLLQRIYY
jgi:hypothetical protein